MSEGKYDIIAGVHGHAAELKLLLEKLGYTDTDGYYHHPEGRRAIFLGNLIDKGKKIRKVLHIVKEMCDHKSAEVILGAAEYQALCFWEINKSKGGYLRKHSLKNILQHSKTIKQFEEHEAEWEEYLQWFMNLPLFLEKPGLRVVHGCWDEKIIEAMKDELPAMHLNKIYLHRSVEKEFKEHRHLRTILKGREATMPKPYFVTDSDGEKKHEVRVRWWMNPKGATFGEYLLKCPDELKDVPITSGNLNHDNYYSDPIPVFTGHYYLGEHLKLQTPFVANLNGAIEKDGELVAYRFNGEKELIAGNFVSVKKVKEVEI